MQQCPAERLALLRFLEEQGVTLAEMVEANAKGRLVGLAGDRQLRSGKLVTLTEIADRTAIDVATLRRITLAIGFPDPGDEAVYPEESLQIFTIFQAASAIFGLEVVLQLGRVIGSSMARIAEAAVAAVQINVDAPLVDSGASEIEIAQSSLRNATLVPGIVPVLELLLRGHLEIANNRRFELLVPALGSTQHMAVAFMDLVGFTDLSERLEVRDLAAAVSAFESETADIITGAGGRLVKMIGDEVMFVAPTATLACRIGLDLVDAFSAHELLPRLRGGIAVGDLIPSDGDYYGTVVNLAARLVKVADAGTILVSTDVMTETSATLHFEASGTPAMKGIRSGTKAYRLLRSDPTA